MKIIIRKYSLILYSVLFLCVSFSSCTLNASDEYAINSAAEYTPTAQVTPEPTVAPTEDIELAPTETIEEYTTITIGSTGDIMAHEMMLRDAQYMAEGDRVFTTDGDESYYFDHWFRHISSSLEYADLMIGNFESTIAIDNSLVAGHPFFATPKEILPSLKAAGFDVLVNGNNHILDNTQKGLIATVDALDEADFYHTGAWKSLEDKNTPLVIDVQGIKVGIISLTSYLNQQEVYLSEAEQEYMYLKAENLSEVSQHIANCKNNGAEVIVICAHWGYQYTETPTSFVTKWAEEYTKLGADIIFGHHPHVLHPFEEIEVTLADETTRQSIVFYSLGNFISNQMGDLDQLTGAIAYADITKNNITGEITIDSASFLPTWCFIDYDNESNSKTYCVLPAGAALDSPSTFEDIETSQIKSSLEDAWKFAIDRLGYTGAEPLRSVSAD